MIAKTSFWDKLPKPFFALAPMANVTGSVFRKLIAKYGKPDVFWTEFVSADGLVSGGKNKLLVDLKFSKNEKPIVAQLFGANPEKMFEAAKMIRKLKFDGLDVNMGCPDRTVEKSGGGAAMMRDTKNTMEIIKASRDGWGASPSDTFTPRANTHPAPLRRAPRSVGRGRATERLASSMAIPISVKTRLGYNKVDLDWIKLLLEQKLPALTVHLRTRKEMSKVPADWEAMKKIIQLRDEISPDTLIIGNGDVVSLEDGLEKSKKYGCDGIMVGRGIFGKPWFFEDLKLSNLRHPRPLGDSSSSVSSQARSHGGLLSPAGAAIALAATGADTSRSEPYPAGVAIGSRRECVGDGRSLSSDKKPDYHLQIMLEHAKSFSKTFKGIKNFDTMKKHFKAYVSGWDGAKELRIKLMEAANYREVKKIVDEYLRKVR